MRRLLQQTHGVVVADGRNRRATLLATAPSSVDQLRRFLGPIPSYEVLELGGGVAAVDATGRTVEGRQLAICTPQPANAGNQPGTFLFANRLIQGDCLLAPVALDAPPLELRSGKRLDLLRFQGAEAVAEAICFDPRAALELDLTIAPRFDYEQLSSFLRHLLEECLDALPSGVIRLEAFDEGGTQCGARVFRSWQLTEARRWCLDNYDAGVNTFWDGLVRRPPAVGTHRRTQAIGAFATAAIDGVAPDITVHGCDGGLPLKLHRDKLAPSPAKDALLSIPLPGLPVRTEDDEILVTWTRGETRDQ